MKVLVVLCLAFSVAYGATDVLDLTDKTFDAEVKKHPFLLVEFYAPWCGHCKKLAPDYEKAATILKDNDPPVSIARVDCTENQATCTRYGVSGYPTLKILYGVESEDAKDYSGGRTADAIVSTIAKQAGPAAVDLKTVEDFNKFMQKETPVVVGFYEEDNSDGKDYLNQCKMMREDYKFGITSSEEVMKEAGAEKNTMKLYRPKRLASKFEDQIEDIEGKPSTLKAYLENNWFGMCYVATIANFDKFPKPLVVTLPKSLDYKKNLKGSNYYRNRVLKWGKEFQDKLNFAIGNFAELQSIAPEDASKGNKDVVVFILGENNKKYSMTDDFGKETFPAFIKAYIDGEIAPFVKSEPVPDNTDGGATVVVGKNFDDVVMDPSKDVLVEFYAPWCGHCKSLAPKWDELAEEMADDDSVVIAKIDATANDSPSQFAVSGFPTIYWAPKGNKENPQKYSGAREVKDFMKFIKDNKSKDDKSEL